MKRIICSIFLTAVTIFALAKPAYASEPIMGEIRIFAGDFQPRSYAFCEGQLIQITDNTALFSLLGTKYGGDGKTTFALPDLRHLEKNLGGARYIIAMVGIYPARN